MFRSIGMQLRRPRGFLGMVVSSFMKKKNVLVYDKIIPELEIKRNDQVLEIGYGHGLGIDRLSSNFDCSVAGIDFSELMLREARKRNKRHIDNRKVELHCADFLTYDLGVNRYDKIFCINVIYFWSKLSEPFAKIQGGLKDEGVFCLFMAHRDHLNKMNITKNDIFKKYTIEYVVDELKMTGFNDIQYRYDTGYLVKCRK
jgi:cyclopropane fatty-acyl-phospholipid synthase-like methyltransferase